MRIDKESLNKLLGKSSEVVVYGLSVCHYLDILGAIIEVGNVDTISYLGGNFPQIAFDTGNDHVKNRCKALITSLLIENVRRKRDGQPIIPLIFCVGLEEIGNNITLNIDKVSQRSISTTHPESGRRYGHNE